ncbi:MAG: CBS domain-containing protein [Candidatus Kuenenia stuttgartiensis]|nr:CBS domain-containing protein [Candidatus Kuenenia stuttgartiensis]
MERSGIKNWKRLLEWREKMLVKEIMSKQLVTLNADSKLGFAEDIMYLGRIRHLPVVNGKEIVGILTQRDLYKASLTSIVTNWEENKTFLDSVKVAEVMTKNVVAISPDTTIEDAAQIMIDKKVGCLPVVEDKNTLLGLITETDVLQYFVHECRKNR